MDKEQIKELEERVSKMTPEEKLKLREEKQKEIDDLMDLENLWVLFLALSNSWESQKTFSDFSRQGQIFLIINLNVIWRVI